MWEEIIKLAVSNGIFAVLFCSLLIYQLKDSAKREQKYQQTIDGLVDKFDIMYEIKEDNEQLKKDNMQIISDNADIKRMLNSTDKKRE
ncbi:MAG: bacteriocin [Clostridiales bacterium]|nr:bacteriocin [Clostridiales bacterium]